MIHSSPRLLRLVDEVSQFFSNEFTHSLVALRRQVKAIIPDLLPLSLRHGMVWNIGIKVKLVSAFISIAALPLGNFSDYLHFSPWVVLDELVQVVSSLVKILALNTTFWHCHHQDFGSFTAQWSVHYYKQ